MLSASARRRSFAILRNSAIMLPCLCVQQLAVHGSARAATAPRSGSRNRHGAIHLAPEGDLTLTSLPNTAAGGAWTCAAEQEHLRLHGAAGRAPRCWLPRRRRRQRQFEGRLLRVGMGTPSGRVGSAMTGRVGIRLAERVAPCANRLTGAACPGLCLEMSQKTKQLTQKRFFPGHRQLRENNWSLNTDFRGFIGIRYDL